MQDRWKVEAEQIWSIPGKRLSKPLTVTIAEFLGEGLREGEVRTSYVSNYYLPSLSSVDGEPVGYVLEGRGDTREEAKDDLAGKLSELWKTLSRTPRTKLSPDARLQKQYLGAVFLS